VSVKELLESLKRDRAALLDAFSQLHFLSQRQKEVVAQGDSACINLYTKEKSQSMEIISKISIDIKKKANKINEEGASGDKSYAATFIANLDKDCQGIIAKIVGIESSDKDFISKFRECLGREARDVEDAKEKLKGLKKGYTETSTISLFDKRG
jgi:hypothetical protein